LTYNNIKPSNILLGKHGKKIKTHDSLNIFKHVKIHLIDFGFTEPYMVNGAHISEKNIGIFRGNMAYASTN
jgi:serine/threonine protein kinase